MPADMLIVSLLVLLFLILFTGLGLPLARRLGQPVPETLFAAFFLGWCLTLAALQLWHLILPVNLTALLLAALLSVVGWVFNARALIGWLRLRPLWLVLGSGLLSAGLVLLLANQALHAPSSYDHGLYHLPMVRWLQTYSIVPGLGNLHHRFAFNNASFLVTALMDSGPAHGLVYYAAMPLLFAGLGLRGLLGVYRTARGNYALRDAFYMLALPLVLWAVTRAGYELAGYNTDAVVFVLQVLLAGETLHLFDQARLGRPRKERLAQALLVVLGAAVGLTVKLSFAVFGLGAGLAAVWAWLLGPRPSANENRAALAWAAGVAALVLVPWLIRGALLSGYPLFPSTLIRLPFQWTMPAAMAEPVAQVIQIWARHGSQLPADTRFTDWMRWWLPRQELPFLLNLAVFVVLTGLVIVVRWVLKRPVDNWRGPAALMVVTGVALLFWFFGAPSLRFAAALPWMLPLFPLLMLIQQVSGPVWWRSPRILALAALLLVVVWRTPEFSGPLVAGMGAVPPRESELAAQTRMYDPERTVQTESGLAVYIGADTNEELCFDQPLPCTRLNDLHPRLALIRPGDLGSGFWIDARD